MASLHEVQVGCGAVTKEELRARLAEAGFASPRVTVQPFTIHLVMLAEK